MKKLLTLVLALILMCGAAVAEEVNCYYDPAYIEGVDGDFYAFNIAMAGEEDQLALASIMLTSIMPVYAE